MSTRKDQLLRRAAGNPGPVFLDVRIEEYKNRVEVSEIRLSEAT